jgi:hypothetical protein
MRSNVLGSTFSILSARPFFDFMLITSFAKESRS